ncbi:MAG TPA: LLM class flavin-dependent oxidoreductase [Nitrososphaerales archaeon]|nr:LLM class flavin-dependent oxidoreductase [Nitrososphaerales archaeon]
MQLLLTTAREVEGMGFGYLLRSDHLLPTDNRRGIDSPECWTSLGAVAASTTRLSFGPLVTPVGFRNPALLAKMACTLHSFSGGRLQLGLGAGWYEAEYTAHGIGFPPFSVRKSQFREALSVILPLIRKGRVDFDGKHYSAHTDCLPRPAGPVHVVVGARTRSIVRVAARLADEWNTLVSPPEAVAQNASLLDSLAAGRRVELSEMGPFLIGRDQSELESNARLQVSKLGQDLTPDELIKRLRTRGAPCGAPEEVADALGKKLDAGVRKFYFQALVPENKAMTELLAHTLKDSFG